MRKLLASVLALCLLVTAAAASGLLINPYRFGGGSPPATPTLTFLQCSGNVSSGTAIHTAAAQNVGTASGTRSTIIGILAEDGSSAYTVDSVTVGGDAATEVVDEGGTNNSTAAIYILSNPAGTSEDVVVTFSEAIGQGMVVCLWSATDLSSLTAVASISAADLSAANPLAINLGTTSVDGVAVGVCTNVDGATRTITWAGLSERAEADPGAYNISAADTSPTNGSSLNISCTWSGGTATHSGAAAAFR